MSVKSITKITLLCFFTLFASLSFCVSPSDNVVAPEKSDEALNQLARVIAGKDIPSQSRLYPYTKSAFYQQYRGELCKGWSQFQQPNMEAMMKWWEKYRPEDTYDTVLYPFSGPDLPHALSFFPDASLYIMFGLESPGPIPDPQKIAEPELQKGLNSIRQSLGTILHVNFFKTEGMAQTLRRTNFNSIGTMIIFFLALHDYEIVGARRIAIDKESQIVQGIPADDAIMWENPPKSRVPGIEISFRKDNGKVQKVRYFMLNVIDYALEKFSPNFTPYLEKSAPFATVVKSASYLMHNNKTKFVHITRAVMKGSRYIVQDDSGVPLDELAPDKWEVSYHGYYLRPIPLFGHRFQPALKKAMDEKSTGPLPFSYGYNFQLGKSNLVTARRIGKD